MVLVLLVASLLDIFGWSHCIPLSCHRAALVAPGSPGKLRKDDTFLASIGILQYCGPKCCKFSKPFPAFTRMLGNKGSGKTSDVAICCDRSWPKLIQNLSKLISSTGSEHKIAWVKPGASAGSSPQWHSCRPTSRHFSKKSVPERGDLAKGRPRCHQMRLGREWTGQPSSCMVSRGKVHPCST